MRYFVEIDGQDQSADIDWESLTLRGRHTRGFSLSFRMVEPASTPQVGQVVRLLYGNDFASASAVFGGKILSVGKTARGKVLVYEVEVKDWRFDFDAKLVSREYRDQSVAQIISDIVANYAPGFTTNGVNCDIVIKGVRFNYLTPSRALDKLAEITGYLWWIDENKDIHFVGKAGAAAPATISEDTQGAVWNSVQIQDDLSQLRNVVIVRGGEMLGTGVVAEDLSHQADGTNKIFRVAYRYANYSLYVDGVQKSVGVEYLDDETQFDALYNFQEKTLRFQTAPAAGSSVVFQGNIYIPVRAVWKEQSSIEKYGERQHVIVDTSIKDVDTAKLRAKSEILEYREKLQDGSFVSYTPGWRPLQRVSIHLPARGITGSYVVQGVVARSRTPQELEWRASVANAEVYDTLDILQRMLQRATEREDWENEALEEVDGFVEELGWQEGWTATIYPTPTPVFTETQHYSEVEWRLDPFSTIVWVAAPYYPTSPTDNKRAGYCDAQAVAG